LITATTIKAIITVNTIGLVNTGSSKLSRNIRPINADIKTANCKINFNIKYFPSLELYELDRLLPYD
jgi:hypothetical protein